MSEYERPSIPRQVFYDARGAVIDYGNRWRDRPGRMPPDDLYEVESNLERFEGLHVLGEALIEHLRQNYAVDVSDQPDAAQDLVARGAGVSRVARLLPANHDGAPLTIVFTSYPGLIVRAGLLHDAYFPTCGCDACDETTEGLAGDVESTVFAVAAGRFGESVTFVPPAAGSYPASLAPSGVLEVGYRMMSPDGSGRRGSHPEFTPSERVKAAQEELRRLPNGWQRWQRRS